MANLSELDAVLDGTTLRLTGTSDDDWLGFFSPFPIAPATEGLIDGGAGDDNITIGQDVSNISVDGGTGDDVIRFSSIGTDVRIEGGTGRDTIQFDSPRDAFGNMTFSGIEAIDFVGGLVDIDQTIARNLDGLTLEGHFIFVYQGGAGTLRFDFHLEDTFGLLPFMDGDLLSPTHSGVDIDLRGITRNVDQDPGDVIVSGFADATTTGTFGADRLYLSEGIGTDATLRGIAGDDELQLFAENGRAFGGAGDDWIWLAANELVAYGGDGNDDFTLRSGNKHEARGGGGDDDFFLIAQIDDVSIIGGAGQNALFLGWQEAVPLDLTGVTLGNIDETFFRTEGEMTVEARALEQFGQFQVGSPGVRPAAAGWREAHLVLAEAEGTAELDARVVSRHRLEVRIEAAESFALDARGAIVNAGAKLTLIGGAGQDILTGSRAGDKIAGGRNQDTLRGHHGDDTLEGGRGDDLLFGGFGDDILTDGGGRDRLTGGTGADRFRLVADGQRDTITDFDPEEDVLDLRAWSEPFELIERKDGLRLKAGGEVLDLLSTDGSLTAASLDGDMILL